MTNMRATVVSVRIPLCVLQMLCVSVEGRCQFSNPPHMGSAVVASVTML